MSSVFSEEKTRSIAKPESATAFSSDSARESWNRVQTPGPSIASSMATAAAAPIFSPRRKRHGCTAASRLRFEILHAATKARMGESESSPNPKKISAITDAGTSGRKSKP